MVERGLIYGAAGCFAATICAMVLVRYNPNPILLVLLPMWGLVFGVALAKVVDLKKK